MIKLIFDDWSWRCENCKRNKANIKDHSILHSWCIPEDIPDCPIEKIRRSGNDKADF